MQEPKKQRLSEDKVLHRMLKTPPKPHKPKPEPAAKKRAKK